MSEPVSRTVCCRCGGYGGEDAANFGERGWHPCYHCGTTGYCECPECRGEPPPPDEKPTHEETP